MLGLLINVRWLWEHHGRLLFGDEVLFEEELLVVGFILLQDVVKVNLVGSLVALRLAVGGLQGTVALSFLAFSVSLLVRGLRSELDVLGLGVGGFLSPGARFGIIQLISSEARLI
ncbi:MAG: hypothetical protein ACMG6E_09285 [Candidatus Roizmanbacteria bacterium]